MSRGACWATVHGIAESDTNEATWHDNERVCCHEAGERFQTDKH